MRNNLKTNLITAGFVDPLLGLGKKQELSYYWLYIPRGQ